METEKYAFIVLQTRVVSGVIWIYGWLDGTMGSMKEQGAKMNIEPGWYKLTSLDEVNA